MRKLKSGVEGLSYNPQLVCMYVEVAIYCWANNLEKQVNGEYHEETIELLE